MLLAAPALAQQTPQPPAEDEGLSGSVSDESESQDLGIAIPVFATDAGVPTSTSAGSTGALGQAPEFQVWYGRSTEMLVQGHVRANADGQLAVGCHLYDLATNSQRLVTESQEPTVAPRWSLDDKWLLYSMAIAGNTDTYKVSASSGLSQRLTDTPGIDVGGSFSPDGSRIVFESDRSGSQQVYVMSADGSNQQRISFFGGRADKIAFNHTAGNFRVAVLSPGGGELRHLIDSWQDEASSWSPNGRIIQFFWTERNSGKASIWQVDLTGRNECRLRSASRRRCAGRRNTRAMTAMPLIRVRGAPFFCYSWDRRHSLHPQQRCSWLQALDARLCIKNCR